MNLINKARTIPNYFYTCAQHYRKEIETVFKNNWIGSGISTARLTKIGDFRSGTICKEPFFVMRSDNGINVFHNVCRHHGTLLLDGMGCVRNIKCPYHGWTYNLDGKLTKATRIKGIEDFNVKDYSLVNIKNYLMGPIIFLGLGKISPFPFNNIKLDFDKLKHVKEVTYNLNCNWKVYVDNYLDGGYHIEHAHPDLQSSLDMSTYKIDIFDRYSVQSCKGKNTRVGAEQQYIFLYPNLMLNRYGRWLDTNTVIPTGPEKCKVVFDYYIEGNYNDADSNDLIVSKRIQDEDEDLCERVQKGMHSSSYVHGRYAPNVEMAMYHFHQLLNQDLGKKLK